RFGMFALAVFPIHTVSGLAGVAGENWVRFVLAVSLGQLAQLYATVASVGVIAEWTTPLVTLLTRHVVPATAVCVGLVAVHLLFVAWRTGRWEFVAVGLGPCESGHFRGFGALSGLTERKAAVLRASVRFRCAAWLEG